MPTPADQLPPDVGFLARELAKLKREVRELRAARRLPHSAIDGGALVVRDDTGSLRAVIGQQDDGTTAVNVVNGPPPPTPSDPIVNAALAALDITWDGTFTDAPAAPLDWMRVEVHVGPAAGFTPDQTTLQSTIETPQGGTVTVSLPYTEWWVKLRCRTTSGVAGPASVAVAGTPRQADAADIVAGAITADLIDVDALNGKTITGSTLQTDTTGARAVITPTPPLPLIQRPSVLMYSGVTGETFPAAFNSGPVTGNASQAQTVLSAPITGADSTGATQTPLLTLNSAKPGTFGSTFSVSTSNHPSTSDLGYVALSGVSSDTASGASYASLYAQDGSSTSKRSAVYVTGAYVNVTADNVVSQFTASGLTIPGTISARNTPVIVTKAAATDRISTTTRTADPDLTMSLAANATYIVEFHMFIGGSSFALVVTEWLVPSGATGLKGAMGPASSATETTAGNNNADGIAMRSGSHGFGTTCTYGRRNVNTNLVYAIETGTVTTTSAGTLALGWAQSTSSTTFNRMGQGSWMRVTRIA